MIVIEENKDNERNKENNDVPALNAEQHNKDSTTTQESVVDDGHRREQEVDNEHFSTNQDNEHSSTNQESGDDDENESGDDDENEAVSSDDESEAVSSEEDDNENEEQVENKDNFGAQQAEEGCSGGTKKRRRFTLQEKLMYLRVVWQKVDKGISLGEASKSINISHKQILDWKKQSEKMKGKSNQHAKSLGDGVTSFLSPYTDRLLSFNSVVNVIQDLGVQVEHIPGGCTSLCQPVDIGINKPFKVFLRKAWEKWMIDEGI